MSGKTPRRSYANTINDITTLSSAPLICMVMSVCGAARKSLFVKSDLQLHLSATLKYTYNSDVVQIKDWMVQHTKVATGAVCICTVRRNELSLIRNNQYN
jgi:hypothetical protein